MSTNIYVGRSLYMAACYFNPRSLCASSAGINCSIIKKIARRQAYFGAMHLVLLYCRRYGINLHNKNWVKFLCTRSSRCILIISVSPQSVTEIVCVCVHVYKHTHTCGRSCFHLYSYILYRTVQQTMNPLGIKIHLITVALL